jgi:hypothetical protein
MKNEKINKITIDSIKQYVYIESKVKRIAIQFISNVYKIIKEKYLKYLREISARYIDIYDAIYNDRHIEELNKNLEIVKITPEMTTIIIRGMFLDQKRTIHLSNRNLLTDNIYDIENKIVNSISEALHNQIIKIEDESNIKITELNDNISHLKSMITIKEEQHAE